MVGFGLAPWLRGLCQYASLGPLTFSFKVPGHNPDINLAAILIALVLEGTLSLNWLIPISLWLGLPTFFSCINTSPPITRFSFCITGPSRSESWCCS
jgi:hypothetical protein